MLLTDIQEKARKTYVKTCAALHPGVQTVYVEAAKIIDILTFEVCEENNLFSYVMETSQEPPRKKGDSSDVLRQFAETKMVGLAPVNPQLLLRLMREAGK